MANKARWIADTQIPQPEQVGFAENADDIEPGPCCFYWIAENGKDGVWCSENDYELIGEDNGD